MLIQLYKGHYLYFEAWQHWVFSGAIWHSDWKVWNFVTLTTFRTFCHLSVICVVYSDLKFVSQQKMELTRENFHAMINYDFRRGLSRQECIDQLISIFVNETPSYVNVKASITSIYVATIRSPTDFVKIVQNQYFDPKTLIQCKNWLRKIFLWHTVRLRQP